ncbi:hypothetical protein BLGI_3510 [Brevibacillus laterosporus GI-9]|nr:hypothetical protein BLGI_3510 [Brevibacillus laterosporus GI-9]
MHFFLLKKTNQMVYCGTITVDGKDHLHKTIERKNDYFY